MIVELRQYTLRPGTRDDFARLFDEAFVASQEEVGITVVGQLHDRDDPDRYVWLRAFPDMVARRASLEAFYVAPCPAWRRHKQEANASILDNDDVLLLRPVAGWVPPSAPVGTPDVTITVWPGTIGLAGPHLVSVDEVNDFPALPVRDEQVTVAIGPHPPVAVTPLQVLHLSPTPSSALR